MSPAASGGTQMVLQSLIYNLHSPLPCLSLRFDDHINSPVDSSSRRGFVGCQRPLGSISHSYDLVHWQGPVGHEIGANGFRPSLGQVLVIHI
jgi:hypothetical protein